MKRRQLFMAGALTLLILLAFTLFRPVPKCEGNRCESFTGTVQKIFEGGENDILFGFYETERLFYINRGLEQGLELDQLKHDLIDKEVTVKYPRYWTPLDPKGSRVHMTFLAFGDEVLFEE